MQIHVTRYDNFENNGMKKVQQGNKYFFGFKWGLAFYLAKYWTSLKEKL
jgi:hypothetical protein